MEVGLKQPQARKRKRLNFMFWAETSGAKSKQNLLFHYFHFFFFCKIQARLSGNIFQGFSFVWAFWKTKGRQGLVIPSSLEIQRITLGFCSFCHSTLCNGEQEQSLVVVILESCENRPWHRLDLGFRHDTLWFLRQFLFKRYLIFLLVVLISKRALLFF